MPAPTPGYSRSPAASERDPVRTLSARNAGADIGRRPVQGIRGDHIGVEVHRELLMADHAGQQAILSGFSEGALVALKETDEKSAADLYEDLVGRQVQGLRYLVPGYLHERIPGLEVGQRRVRVADGLNTAVAELGDRL